MRSSDARFVDGEPDAKLELLYCSRTHAGISFFLTTCDGPTRPQQRRDPAPLGK